MENKKNSEYPGKGETDMKIIAKIRSDFPTKFGIPRQSGRVEGLTARIVFEPEYRVREAVKGLEDFSHIWLIWEFSEAVREKWSPTVRPPCLGGNERMGVFATRSPFRPNSIGLSCVKLEQIDLKCKEGPVLVVSGADLMDGTPIFDIKPYIPAADCHPEALGGFAEKVEQHFLKVEIPQKWVAMIPEEKLEALKGVLREDPRPAYQKDPRRIYGMPFAGMDVHFQVKDGVLSVCGITEYKNN